MRKIICILLLTALLLSTLAACNAPDKTPDGTPDAAPDNVANDSSADTTADGATTAPTDTMLSDTSPAFDESLYKLCGGLVCKGGIKQILDTYRSDDRLGFVGIAGHDFVVRAFAITQADWYENTEQELASRGYLLKTPDFDVTKYDSAYFDSKILLMIHITAPSDTTSYDVSVAKHDINFFDAYIDIVKTASDATSGADEHQVYFIETDKPTYPTVDLLIMHYSCIDKTADPALPENASPKLRAGMSGYGSMKEVLDSINSLYDYMPGEQAAYGLGGIREQYRLRTYAITQADWCEIPEYYHIQTPDFDASKYDEEFFKDNYLIMMLMSVGDIDHAHSPYNISLTGADETAACIDIEYIKYTGEYWTNWQEYRYLYFFEVKKPANSEYHMVEYNFYAK